MHKSTKFLYVLSFLVALLWAFSSCGDSAPAAEEDSTANVAPETAPEEAPATPEPVEAPNTTIGSKQVGDFAIKAGMPEGGAYTVAKEMRTQQGEGEAIAIPAYMVKDGETVLLDIKPYYDVSSSQFTDQPGEILVRDGRFRTEKGIGVGSTLEETLAAYADAELWYTYVGEMFVAQSPALEGVQFLIQADAYTGKADLMAGDMVSLQKEDFKAGATITQVRVY